MQLHTHKNSFLGVKGVLNVSCTELTIIPKLQEFPELWTVLRQEKYEREKILK